MKNRSIPVALLAVLVFGVGVWSQTNVNTVQFGGTAVAVNSGNKDNGTIRMVLATDQPTMSNAQPVTANAGTNLNTSALMTSANFTTVLGTASMVQTATLADNLANTTDAISTRNLGYVFDGSTWDRVRGDSTNGTLVNLGANNDVAATLGAETTKVIGTVRTADGSGNLTYVDPCQREAKLYITVNQTANAQYVTGTASERVYICSINIMSEDGESVALVSGTGTVCATSTSGVDGITAATAATGWPFGANGGLVYGNGASSVGQTDTNADNVCVYQSGSGQISGGFTYVSQ